MLEEYIIYAGNIKGAAEAFRPVPLCSDKLTVSPVSTMAFRPHVLGVDDAPFSKKQSRDVPVVGVMMEGATLVEGVALGSFPVDGAGATGYLGTWISEQRWHASLQAVVLGGITIAGLGVVDVRRLAEVLDAPVLTVTRKSTSSSDLTDALRAAGFSDRIPVVNGAPQPFKLKDGLYVTASGLSRQHATHIVRSTLNKAKVPEPLRVAHLVGAALVNGTSRGRA